MSTQITIWEHNWLKWCMFKTCLSSCAGNQWASSDNRLGHLGSSRQDLILGHSGRWNLRHTNIMRRILRHITGILQHISAYVHWCITSLVVLHVTCVLWRTCNWILQHAVWILHSVIHRSNVLPLRLSIFLRQLYGAPQRTIIRPLVAQVVPLTDAIAVVDMAAAQHPSSLAVHQIVHTDNTGSRSLIRRRIFCHLVHWWLTHLLIRMGSCFNAIGRRRHCRRRNRRSWHQGCNQWGWWLREHCSTSCLVVKQSGWKVSDTEARKLQELTRHCQYTVHIQFKKNI